MQIKMKINLQKSCMFQKFVVILRSILKINRIKNKKQRQKYE